MTTTDVSADPTPGRAPGTTRWPDLTDEELFALVGPDQGVVTLPYLRRIAAADRETVRSVAVRGLFARGLLRPAGEDDAAAAGPDERVVRLDATLDRLLTIRRAPETVLAAQRTTGLLEGPEVLMRYAFLDGEDVLIEDVSTSGIHRFGMVPRGELAAAMQQFLASPTARSVHLPADAWPARSRPTQIVPNRDGCAVLGGAHVVAEIIVRFDDTPADVSHTAYVHPDAAYVGAAPLDDPGAAVLTRIDASDLGTWAVGLVSSTGAAVRSGPAGRVAPCARALAPQAGAGLRESGA